MHVAMLPSPADRAAPPRRATALLTAALLASVGTAHEQPPQVAARGVTSFRTLSRVRFASEPESHHTLEAHYIGSERARLLLEHTEDGRRNRVLNYRFGDDCYVVPLAEDVATSAEAEVGSVQLEGEERTAFVRGLEIRRALLSWPAGFSWRKSGAGHETHLGPLGRLEVRVGDDDLPLEVTAYDAAGQEQESLREVAWRTLAGRPWPTRFELTFQGRPIWTEEVLEARGGIRFVDLFFVPRDRRAKRAPFRERTAGLEHVDRPDAWERRLPLESARDDWDAAWSEATVAARRAHEALRAKGCDHAPVASIALDESGRAQAIALHLRADVALPDDRETSAAWTRSTGGPGIRLGAASLAEAAGEGLRRARAALPEGMRVEGSRASLVGDPEAPLAVLVLTLAPVGDEPGDDGPGGD